LEQIALSRTARRELLNSYLQFFSFHIPDFGTLRSWQVVQEILQ